MLHKNKACCKGKDKLQTVPYFVFYIPAVCFQVLPMATACLDYVLYPLLAGESVQLPQLKLTSVRLAQLTEDLEVTLSRLLPRSITVLPRNRTKATTKATESSALPDNKFQVGQSFVMECKPFSAVKPAVKT